MATIEQNLGVLFPGMNSYLRDSLASDDKLDLHGFSIFNTQTNSARQVSLKLANESKTDGIALYLYRDVDGNGIYNTSDQFVPGGSMAIAAGETKELKMQLDKSGQYLALVLPTKAAITENLRYSIGLASDPNSILQPEVNAGTLGSNLYTHTSTMSALNPENIYSFSMARPGNFNAALDSFAQTALRLIKDVNNNGQIDVGEVIAEGKGGLGRNQKATINVRGLEAGNYFLETSLRTYGLKAEDAGTLRSYDLKMSNTGTNPNNLLAISQEDFGFLGSSSFDHLKYEINRDVAANSASAVYGFTMREAGNFNLGIIQGLEEKGISDFRLIRDANNNGVVDAGEVVFKTEKTNPVEMINLHNLSQGRYFLQANLNSEQKGGFTFYMTNSGSNPGDLVFPLGEGNLGTLGSSPYTRRDSVSLTDAVDTFKFATKDFGDNVNISLTNITPGADIGVRLVQDVNNNRYVDYPDFNATASGSGDVDRVINQRVPKGQYFVQVYAQNNTVGDYKLQISNTGKDPSNLLPAETLVGEVNDPVTFYNVLEDVNTADTYKFSIETKRSLTLSLKDLYANADLRILQDKNSNGILDPGEELKRSASLGNASETITRVLNPGDYIAQVYSAGQNEHTSYALDIA